jgi:hypothetical protein
VPSNLILLASKAATVPSNLILLCHLTLFYWLARLRILLASKAAEQFNTVSLFSFFFVILFVFTLIFFSSCLRFFKGSVGAARANAISKYRRGSKATDPVVVAESPPGVGAEGVVLVEPLLQVITTPCV